MESILSNYKCKTGKKRTHIISNNHCYVYEDNKYSFFTDILNLCNIHGSSLSEISEFQPKDNKKFMISVTVNDINMYSDIFSDCDVQNLGYYLETIDSKHHLIVKYFISLIIKLKNVISNIDDSTLIFEYNPYKNSYSVILPYYVIGEKNITIVNDYIYSLYKDKNIIQDLFPVKLVSSGNVIYNGNSVILNNIDKVINKCGHQFSLNEYPYMFKMFLVNSLYIVDNVKAIIVKSSVDDVNESDNNLVKIKSSVNDIDFEYYYSLINKDRYKKQFHLNEMCAVVLNSFVEVEKQDKYLNMFINDYMTVNGIEDDYEEFILLKSKIKSEFINLKYLTFNTIKWYACQDNNHNYMTFITQEVCDYLDSIGEPTNIKEFNVAKIFYIYYSMYFFYAYDEKESERWYIYDSNSNMWCNFPSGSYLKNYVRQLENIIVEQINKPEYSTHISIISKILINSYSVNTVCRELESLFCMNSVNMKLSFKQIQNYNPSITNLGNCIAYRVNDKLEITKGKPEDYINKVTGVKYNSNYTYDSPEIKLCLQYIESMIVDKELNDYIWRLIASAFYGRNTDKCFINLIGDGNNGKSVFINILQQVFGTYATNWNVNTVMIQKGGKSSDGPTPHFINANGARWVFIQESAHNTELDIALMKTLTGNDVMPFRDLYQSGKDMNYAIATYKPVLISNHNIVVNESAQVDEAFWNRFQKVVFSSKFVDKNIAPKTRKEQLEAKIFPVKTNMDKILPELYPAFLWIAIDRYKDYSNTSNPDLIGSLRPPQEVIIESLNIKRKNNPYYQFYSKVFKTEESITSYDNLESIQEKYSQIYDDLNKRGFVYKDSNKYVVINKGIILYNIYNVYIEMSKNKSLLQSYQDFEINFVKNFKEHIKYIDNTPCFINHAFINNAYNNVYLQTYVA